MSNPHQPDNPQKCARPHAQQMRIKLARTRVAEIRNMDLGLTSPAGLIVAVERLANTVDDLLDLVDQGCTDKGADH